MHRIAVPISPWATTATTVFSRAIARAPDRPQPYRRR